MASQKSVTPNPAPDCVTDCVTDQRQPDQLQFLPLAEWEEGSEYDEQPPRDVCYTFT